MAQINNSESIKRMLDDGGIQTAHDQVPTQLASKVVPVLVANAQKVVNVVQDATSTTTGATTIYTTPTDRDFFLTGVFLSNASSALQDGTLIEYSIYVGGSKEKIIRLRKLTLVAYTGTAQRDLSVPIKLDRGSIVELSHTFSAGTSTTSASLTGYTITPPNL